MKEMQEVSKMNEAFVEEGVDVDEYVALQRELDELEQQAGIREEKGLVRLISGLFERGENREKVAVSKKKYLWLIFLLGWCGGHRFYSKQYVLGAVYLLFFWTCFPICMSIVDFLQVLPKPADENGNILI